jgi:hypothetical protein
MNFRKTTLFTGVALSLFACLALAQTKQPDVNGVWKMNAAKSQFGRGGPDAITFKFELKDAILSETLTLTNKGNERLIENKYTTDGKEQDVNVGGDPAKATVSWEGATLIIAWKSGDNTFTRRCTFSADGKTMTLAVRQTRDGESVDDTVVFDKQ